MIIIFSLIIISIYFFTLIYFLFGITKTKLLDVPIHSSPSISVILCVRNGQDSITNILNDFLNQDYIGPLEFIIVDDNSQDQTKKIIQNYTSYDCRIKYFHSHEIKNSNLYYKKRALNVGIKNAKNKWLLFTDVDCRVQKGWVSSMAANYKESDYVIGYSEVESSKSLVSKFQNIDFKMLMFSACASTKLGTPLACSGQNQSYKKSLFKKVGGFDEIKQLLQGDDSLFLQLCKSKEPIKINFSFYKNSFIVAKTHNSIKDFILQRMRWAGDANIMWKFNKIFFVSIFATFFTNLFIISLFVFPKYFFLLLILILTKFIFEYLIYFFGSKKFEKKIKFSSFILWFVLQPFYIVLMGFLSFFAFKINWKSGK